MSLRFTDPYFLALLLAALPVLYWHLRTSSRREPRLGFSSLNVLGRLRPSWRQAWLPVIPVLRGITLVLLVIGLARPSVSRAAEVTPGSGIDITLAIDVSYSMSEKDLGPKSRLETAKEVVREFVGGRQSDRIGLVAFAAEAVAVSPLTTDYPLLLQFVDDLNHGRLPEGTAIGTGLATAVNLLREAPGKSRIVVLLTDGQSNAGDISPMNAAKMAQLLNLRVYTVGVGAAPRADRDGRRTGGGGVDEETLRQISESTGAAYFRATDESSLKQIYDLIGRLEKTQTGEQHYVIISDLSVYFLLAACVALLSEVTLRNTLLRRVP